MDETAACFICRKHRGAEVVPGDFIYRDDLLLASHAYTSEAPATYLGWVVIEPKRHVAGLEGLTDEEAAALGRLAARLSRVLKAELGAEHIYAFVLGHHVPHLHLHLIVRYPGTPREYWGQRVDEWPGAPRGNMEEVERLAARLRQGLLSEA